MLSHAAQSCAGFGTFLQKQLAAHASDLTTPWSIILYSDEVSPGNQLKHDNKRKLQTVYWSFREFDAGLCSEALRFVLTAVRSSMVVRMGGMSVLFKHMLLPFYDDHDFRFGVTVRVHDRTHMIFASLGIVVSDEAALKSTWEMKGASGTLTCMACRNVVSVSSDLHNTDATGFFAPSSETDVSKFVLQTDDSVR
ncbi:unnamed protein product [Polarella glacialis]|uniref:Uncharacterized protein n=1 Tax=Polarella glacialis TaxID=89957 RepID=A0A813LH48_POLGL|nr:unnamed protein product [Polarella glacialis]